MRLLRSLKSGSAVKFTMLATIIAVIAVTTIGFQNCARIDFNGDDVVQDGKNAGLDFVPPQPVLECRTAGGVENIKSSITGPKELEQGEVGTFTLPGLENCDNRFAVSWYTTDQDQHRSNPVQSGPKLQVGFGLPGVYLIVARVLDSDLHFKDVTHQVLVREKCRSGSACNDEIGRSAIRGPTVGYVGDLYRFEVSSKTPLNDLVWYFGNSSSRSANGRTEIDLSFRTTGIHTIRAEFEDSSGKKQILTHDIYILERDKVPGEGPCDENCNNDDNNDDDDDEQPALSQCDLSRLDLSGPSTLGVKEKGRWTIYLPDCVKTDLEHIEWIVDSSSPAIGDSSKELSFDAPGLHNVKARIRIKRPSQGGQYTDITISRPVWVIEEQCRIEVPPVVPPVVPPNSCFPLKEGEAVEEIVGISYRDLACGLDGTKRVRYDLVRSRTCEAGRIVFSPTTERKVSEGTCSGQSCLLQNGSKLKDKQSVIRYSMNLPGDSCKNHEVAIGCSNGLLSRSDKDLHESCLSGCPGLGVHGTQSFALDGEEKVAKICPFGETGSFDRYKKEMQLKCMDGAVSDTGVQRRGDLIEAGICPTYTWKISDWTQCSAECGGEQSAIYVCQNNAGAAIADSAEAARRCGPVPTQKRVCSRNPDSSYEETRLSYLPGTAMCPKNQIGAVLTRVSTVSTYSCQNHKYEKVSETSSNTTENYCKPYTASRCSHDSLSTTQALGRYLWLKKCEPTVPMIADFFEKMKGIKENPEEIYKASAKVDSKGNITVDRLTYATFMKVDGKPWIAPAPSINNASGVANISCDIPAGTTIASVCLSSCLTPTQSLAVDLRGGQMSILDAMTSQVTSLPALTAESSLGDVKLRQMKVDKFVTELIDTEHVILAIKTAKGRAIELTPNHPVLISTGVLVEAKNLTRGHELLGKDGQPDAIVQIEEKSHFGKVYNVFMGTSVPEENLILSQDLIIGSGQFQNESSDYINRTILRKKLVEGALK